MAFALPGKARELGHRLQHRAASLGARLSHTGGKPYDKRMTRNRTVRLGLRSGLH